MIFKSVKIKNFRQYRDVEIEFSDSINLIEAGNGVGKSTLMGAIIFAIYGLEELKHSKLLEVGPGKPLYNIDCVDLGALDKVVEVILEIEMPNNRLYQIQRIYDTVGKKDNSKAYLIAPQTNYMQEQIEISEVVSLVPQELIPLLFFDGERVKTIEDSFSGSTKKFKDEVEKILKIDTYNNAKNFINRCKKRLLTSSEFENPELLEIEKEIEGFEERLERFTNELSENTEKLEITRNKVESDKYSLKQLEDSKQKIEKMEDLEKQKKAVEVEYNEFKFKSRKQLILSTPDIIRLNLFDTILKTIQQDTVSKSIRGIEQSAIDIIIANKKCICGTTLDERLIYNLSEFRHSLPPESFQTILSYGIENKENNLDEIYDSITSYADHASKKRKQVRELDDEITQITQSLRDQYIGNEIEELTSSLERGQFEIGSLTQTNSQLSENISKLEKILSDKRAKLGRILKKEENAKLETIAISLLASSESRLEELINNRKTDMCKKMELKVNEIANQLLFDEIEITLNNSLKPKDITLKNGTTNLSTGQKVNVSLAYLFALMDISKTELEYGSNEFSSELHPIILDGITATLDENHTKKVINHLVSLEGQTIIFANTKEVKQYEKGFDKNYKKFNLIRGMNDSYVTVEVENEF